MANREQNFVEGGTDDVERRENVDKGADMFRIADEKIQKMRTACTLVAQQADSNARLAGRVEGLLGELLIPIREKRDVESRERSSQVHVYALRRFRGTAVTETRPRVIPGFVRVVTNRR